MAHHEDVLFEFRVQIRAWGSTNYQTLMNDVADQMKAGTFRSEQASGVRLDIDPGSGGPYQTVVQEPWTLRTDGVGLPGYPGYEDD